MKQSIYNTVEEKAQVITDLSDKIWGFAELSLQEFQSAALYVKVLKENGFEVTDRISVFAAGNDKLTDIMSRNEDFIKKIVLGDSISYGTAEVDGGFAKEWNINGEDITLAIK